MEIGEGNFRGWAGSVKHSEGRDWMENFNHGLHGGLGFFLEVETSI